MIKRIVNTDPTSPVPADTIGILESVIEERDRAMQKWGVQSHPDGTADSKLNVFSREKQRERVDRQAETRNSNWFDILLEEVKEARAESDLVALDKELCQVMQVCLVWREDIWRRMAAIDQTDSTGEVAEEKAMRELADRVSTSMSPALRSLSKGFNPGRQYMLDNIRALRVHSRGRSKEDLDALVQLEAWVKGLPASWWDANFKAEPAEAQSEGGDEWQEAHDVEVSAALQTPFPGVAVPLHGATFVEFEGELGGDSKKG